MKFFLMILLFCLFILVAICTYLYFLFRKKLFADMVYIGKYLKNNITFNKKNVNELLSNSFENVSQSSKFIIKNHARVGKFFYKGGDILNDFFGKTPIRLGLTVIFCGIFCSFFFFFFEKYSKEF